MSNITSFETLDEAIGKMGGKPIVLEVAWMKETRELPYLLLYLHTALPSGDESNTQQHFLGEVTVPHEMDYFTDGKLTVGVLAKSFGEQAAKKYGLFFYFPSDNGDDDSPRWTERHLAIPCTGCGKLIMPTNRYSQGHICGDCFRADLEKKWNNDRPN